ncbi:T6SS effector BTH_I2691 family protein [Burkholderia cepacia]|uniref:T6SS effector BTH_I2691 family protein n=1 Tax=Burkholderia cepacia TaxID=292 RepID=UPI002FDF668D
MTKPAAGGSSSAPSCSSRVPILPIRYAIVPRDDKAPFYRYADAGFKLEKGFKPLKRSAYTLRALRPGYVYVFMKGTKGEQLVIHEYDGEGRYKELKYGSLEQYHRKDRYKTGNSMGWVWADTCQDKAKEVWIGYSPHLWTNAMTTRITSDPAMRQRHMRRLDMAELTSGEKAPSSQPHVLPASALSKWVEDCKPKSQRIALNWSSHASKDDLPVSTFLAQGQHYRFTQPRVPVVVVLNDAEGISLDLGLSVAAYQHQLRDILPTQQGQAAAGQGKDQPQAPSVPACFRMDVEKLSAQSKDYHHKNLVAAVLEQTLQSMYPANQPKTEVLVKLREEHQTKQVGGKRRATPSELRYQVLTDKGVSPIGNRLGDRIDTAKYHQFLAERDQREAQLRTHLRTALLACTDHDQWLATAESRHRNEPTSLAAALATYDRDEQSSARGLEMTLALMLHPMSQALPGTDDEDARFQRLSAWLDQHDSPLYLALAPYNPFKQKADAVGVLLGAADGVIEGLAGRFPAAAGITDLTAEAVTTVTLKRLQGKTRWDASRNLRQQVLAAAAEANAEKALGLLSARYGVTNTKSLTDPLSKEVDKFVKSGMADFEEIKRVRVSGSRTVTVEATLIKRVRPNIAALATTAGGGVLNVAMLYFNVIALKSAYASLCSDPAFENAAGFASAILGVTGALVATGASARSAYKIIVLRYTANAPGMAFGNGVMSFITGNLFSRLLGYPTIVSGFLSDSAKMVRQIQNGDSTAGFYTATGGIAVAAGSALILEAGLAIAAPTAVIPVAGWAAAAIVLFGAGVLAGGVWLHAQAAARIHSPIELWAARGLFGKRLNDGEKRDDIKLDANGKLPPFPGVHEEIKAWYAAYYAPVLLTKKDAEAIGIKGIDSTWHRKLLEWSYPDWGRIATNQVPQTTTTVEFAVLLRGYVMGQSHWSEVLEQGNICIAGNPICYDTRNGLVLHFKKEVTEVDRMALSIYYKPSQGLDESAMAVAQFQLER